MFKLWKKKANQQFSQKIKINVPKLKQLLGGQSNILSAVAQNIKVKITVASSKTVIATKIQKLYGISGVLLGNDHITIIVGKQARELSNLLVKD